MKRMILFSIILVFAFLISNCNKKPATELTESAKAGLRSDAKEFMQTLKSILVKEIQNNGLTAAVSVCSDTAQILTNNFGVSKGIYIKRVSFKNRNPNDYPNDVEAKGLKYFEELKSEGQLNESTEYVEIIEVNGVKKVQYLKPILIQPTCLNCHGEEKFISPEVKTIINQKYPNDKATGYNLNDLRGAISIQKVL
jgi:hypothetical protein